MNCFQETLTGKFLGEATSELEPLLCILSFEVYIEFVGHAVDVVCSSGLDHDSAVLPLLPSSHWSFCSAGE